jgi:hypothetical protein
VTIRLPHLALGHGAAPVTLICAWCKAALHQGGRHTVYTMCDGCMETLERTGRLANGAGEAADYTRGSSSI